MEVFLFTASVVRILLWKFSSGFRSVVCACSRACLKKGHLDVVKQGDGASHNNTFVKSGTYFCVLTDLLPFHMTVYTI